MLVGSVVIGAKLNENDHDSIPCNCDQERLLHQLKRALFTLDVDE
jgi:hypothetical protein